MTCNHNCNQGRACDCVANEEYASSTVAPASFNTWSEDDWARYHVRQARDAQNAYPQSDWMKEYSKKDAITMEENPVSELLRDAKRYVINALAGIGILATIAFIGMVSAGYFGK